MNNQSDSTAPQNSAVKKRWFFPMVVLPLALIAAGLLAGCQTQTVSPAYSVSEQDGTTNELTATNSELLQLREGDVVNISFPDSPTFDTTQPIRRDGRITLKLIGDVDVVGLTPSALEAKLLDLYATQLTTKQVTVEVVSSTLLVYVTGMVMHPGKVVSDHPITALEAVMEAGGFDYATANPKDVTVIRREGNVMKHYMLNLKDVLRGKQSEPFFLKPGDIIYVPERFSMF